MDEPIQNEPIQVTLPGGVRIAITAIEDEEQPGDEKATAQSQRGRDDVSEAETEYQRIKGWDALPEAMRSYVRLSGGFVRSAAVEQSAVSDGLPDGFERQRDDSFIFLASEPVPGRDGYILAGPWDLSEYRLNPVILWAHNYSWNAKPKDELPIGRALQVVEPEEGYLYVEVLFDEQDEMGALVAGKYRSEFLNAVSVRWAPTQIVVANQLPEDNPYYVDDEDLYVMFGCRLVEISAVPIPGLATAVQVRHTDTRKQKQDQEETPPGEQHTEPQGWWSNLNQQEA